MRGNYSASTLKL